MKEMILNNDVWETSPVTDHLKFQVPIYTKDAAVRHDGVEKGVSFIPSLLMFLKSQAAELFIFHKTTNSLAIKVTKTPY